MLLQIEVDWTPLPEGFVSVRSVENSRWLAWFSYPPNVRTSKAYKHTEKGSNMSSVDGDKISISCTLLASDCPRFNITSALSNTALRRIYYGMQLSLFLSHLTTNFTVQHPTIRSTPFHILLESPSIGEQTQLQKGVVITHLHHCDQSCLPPSSFPLIRTQPSDSPFANRGTWGKASTSASWREVTAGFSVVGYLATWGSSRDTA